MRNAKRGRGSRHGVYVCVVAALGFALSGCGGGGSSSSAASAQQSSAPAQSSTATSSATSATSTQSSTATASSGAPAASSQTSSAGSGAPATASTTSVTINWVAPTENTDGTALTNLSGYNIHYGTASHNYTQTIPITTPGIATYVVQNLTPGTYYFAVAAVNSAGTESPLSSEVSATVN